MLKKCGICLLRKFRSDFPSQKMFGQKLVSKPIEIATEMNRFFIEKIKKSPVDSDPMKELRTFLTSKGNLENKIQFEIIDHEQIKNS